MTIEEMKKKKTELGLTSEMISQLSGVPLGTVQKIFAGTTKAPRRLTIEALEKVLGSSDPFENKANQHAPMQEGYYQNVAHPHQDCMLREAPASYGTAVQPDEASQAAPAAQDPRYTLDDYYALPDEQRVELIDGVFYDMAAPSYLHQLILIHLSHLFYDCATQHDTPC